MSKRTKRTNGTFSNGVRAFVVLWMVAILPWKLIALVPEVLWMSPGNEHYTDRVDKYWDALSLEAKLVGMGWSVEYRPRLIDAGAYGMTSLEQHRIIVDDSLDWNARFAVLSHEAGHTLQPTWVTQQQGEAWAESVAMLIAHDGLREHARYLSHVKVDFLMMVLTEWPSIYDAAAVLQDH
jgi:hypothetical protein